ncbi:ThuA domain-containing protein [Maribacter algicola]|uniref:ThuA domain-containing protein n=1 Tax=Maribacter algicola TaxID=2498892 RepID=A0A426RLB3_9FLAO|nr:ThuA domain-containing protein [Maribacter algicola]RRQ49783.1 ThuA domain-containing protein [Maribacter algicola]
MKKVLPSLIICATLMYSAVSAQELKPLPITDEWLASIYDNAPSKTTVVGQKKRKVLVFSKATGFDHWTIPHNNEVWKILASKTGAFEVQIGFDITHFEKKSLKNYDAVILNNSNPTGPERNLFYDLLKKYSSISDEEANEKALHYESNLLEYVKKGGGLVIMHGAIVVQNNSPEFSTMTGGSFDYHPKQQEIHLKEVDKDHPLVSAFNGKGLKHIDEPYFFKNAYFDYNFRPLLYFEVDKIEGIKHKVKDVKNYVSWIKKYGKGRVFYSAPSHNAQSLQNPELFKFYLDGLQYVTGDLKVDDTPMNRKP